MENCKFCRIAKGELNSYRLYEDEKFFAFLDINPIQEGHFMIIPKKHSEYIFDLEEPDYTELMLLAKKLSKNLKEATRTKKIGLAVEGFGEEHLHIHLVPLQQLGDLDPCKHKRAMDDHLKMLHKKLLPYFNSGQS